jgi:hypothetical protein
MREQLCYNVILIWNNTKKDEKLGTYNGPDTLHDLKI